ncbi:hypothetical protein [Kangiella koreensis]|uniref:Uncharacterized protein n=1 Tax=Kangiella koreensis (strain DSM 16069 / JCM 12317 / KCTC 12182 / SW-125) TaxID=523791 RepID=C7RAU5_KANKD|nr:hypothetical protein [Kangiella koreensis]ACV26387.1 conserved hypothetical protein [Kangiella koreensis DSM 16069]
MNPIEYIITSRMPRGWKIISLSFAMALFIGLPLLWASAFLPEGGFQVFAGLAALFIVIAGLISMIGGFIVLLVDIYRS